MASERPDVEICELFEESALSDDPVFAAYLPDRDPVVELESGAELTRSNLQFCFFEPGEIGVLTAESQVEGDMSTLLDRVCRHFGETDVVFYNVLSKTLAEKVRGFEWTERTLNGEPMRCLEGEWEPERRAIEA